MCGIPTKTPQSQATAAASAITNAPKACAPRAVGSPAATFVSVMVVVLVEVLSLCVPSNGLPMEIEKPRKPWSVICEVYVVVVVFPFETVDVTVV